MTARKVQFKEKDRKGGRFSQKGGDTGEKKKK